MVCCNILELINGCKYTKKKTKNYVAISFRHSFPRVRVQARTRVSSRQKIFSAAPSTPPTPNVCKHLIFRGHFQVFWVLGKKFALHPDCR